MKTILQVSAVLGGVAALIGIATWAFPPLRRVWARCRHRTMAVVPSPGSGTWYANENNPERISVQAFWYFTNLTERPLRALNARLLTKPGDETDVWMEGYADEEETIRKEYIGPHQTEVGTTHFSLMPRKLPADGEPFISDVQFVDSHGNTYRLRRVRFTHSPRRRT